MGNPVNRRRELRRNQTAAERLLWGALRSRNFHGLKFRRQYPVGPFVVDFACPDRSLVIEVDGGYHDFVERKDLSRQEFIESRGFMVLRFENAELENDLEVALVAIGRALGIETPRK